MKPYTPESLADEWQCSAKHVRSLIKGGKLRAFKLGGKLYRIAPEWVREFERCQATQYSDTENDGPSPSSTTKETDSTVTVLQPKTRAELSVKRRESTQR